MARNVEVKARLSNSSLQMRLAERITQSPGRLIEQEDTFFHCSAGRLKLRMFSETLGEVIFYQRADNRRPETSTYQIAETHEPAAMRDVLRRAHGIVAVVRKARRLFLAGRTRIHIDTVEGLGDFLELEVVLGDREDAANGSREVAELMAQLQVPDASLIDVSYVDLLLESQGG